MRFVSLVAACSIAVTSCGAGSNEKVTVAPVSASDPSGDGAPPQLDLVAAGIAIKEGSVTLTWTVAAPLDSVAADPDAVLSWSMVISDGDRGRVIAVRKSADGARSSVEFASPKDQSRVDLPPPDLEGNTVRLVVPLRLLKWSGGEANWVTRTSMRLGEEDPVDVDEIASRTFKP